MEFLGVRILSRLPAEAEYAQDYTILWSYEGPNPLESLETMLDTTDLAEEYDYIVQVKKWECGAIVWKTVEF